MTRRDAEAPRSLRLDALRVVLLVTAVAGHGMWAASLISNQGQPELLRRDFIVLHHAAHAAPEALYAPSAFPFLHPPPVAALSRLLAPLPPLGIYGVVLGLNVLALVALVVALWRLRHDPPTRDLILLAALASAPWWIQLMLGQPAAVWPMLWAVGLLLSRRHPLWGGLVWSLTGLKPVFLVGPLVLALVRGRRSLAGLALGLLGLGLVSLPLGADVWLDWLAALEDGLDLAAAPAALFKQHTVRASLVWLGVPHASWLAWLGTLGWGAGTLLVVWRRRDDPFLGLSLLALATVALSPYLYFYDAFLLLLPAAYRWRSGHVSASSWIAAALFLLQLVLYFGPQEGAPFGLITAIWLTVELASAVTARREVGSPVPADAA